MPVERDHPGAFPPEAAQFTTTHWSVVLNAGRIDSREATEALEQLCRAYWYPLYAFVRREGYSPEDAQDLTQEFFGRLLQRNDFAKVHPEKGRFRSFLLASLKHFLANEWKRAHRLKRGGSQVFVPIDMGSAETRYGVDPSHELTPDKLFDRRWALTVLEQSLARLREEQVQGGKAALFEELKVFLTGDDNAPAYVEIALRLAMSEDAVKMAVSRLRKRYRELLRSEVAQTMANPAEVDAELRQMLAALA